MRLPSIALNLRCSSDHKVQYAADLGVPQLEGHRQSFRNRRDGLTSIGAHDLITRKLSKGPNMC